MFQFLYKLYRRTALRQLGPGLITGAADDDPSGIATYSQAGAQFGFNMLWTVVFTYPLMVGIQMVSARIGRVTRQRPRREHPQSVPALAALLPSSSCSSRQHHQYRRGHRRDGRGAATCWRAGRATCHAVGFGVVSLVLQVFIPYQRYVRLLKWLTLGLLAYVAVVFTVEVHWVEALHSARLAAPGADPGRDHGRGRRVRHHDQPLSLLLAGVAGSGGHERRPARGSARDRRPRAGAGSCGASRSTPTSAWDFRT